MPFRALERLGHVSQRRLANEIAQLGDERIQTGPDLIVDAAHSRSRLMNEERVSTPNVNRAAAREQRIREPLPRDRPDACPPPEPSDDWPIRVGVVGLMMTIALYVIARKALPWFAWMRVRLSRRWKRVHPGRRRLVARSHRRR